MSESKENKAMRALFRRCTDDGKWYCELYGGICPDKDCRECSIPLYHCLVRMPRIGNDIRELSERRDEL